MTFVCLTHMMTMAGITHFFEPFKGNPLIKIFFLNSFVAFLSVLTTNTSQ